VFERHFVLIVDDEKPVLSAVRRLLREIPAEVFPAQSGEEALALAEDREFAVIICDQMMPGMKGIEVLSIFKDRFPDTARILMTGHADLKVAIDAINRGEVFRFIVKPWNDEELVKTVLEGIERFNLIKTLKSGDEAKLLSLAQTIELKDPYTRGHCDRVATYSLMISRELGYTSEQQRELKYGAWLHDCGKIGVPETILNARRKLREEEIKLIRNHPRWGVEVARQASLPEITCNVILYHHEQFDGRGYPEGLKGTEIPEEARIVAVADVFDALTTERPYQGAMTTEEGLGILQELKGSVLDPKLVEIFTRLVREEERSITHEQAAR